MSGTKRVDAVEGGYYAFEETDADGAACFGLLKVLKVDPGGVHVRLYEDQFPTMPTAADTQGLDYVLGHLPVTTQQFDWWRPSFVSKGIVVDDELDGYQLWLDGGGLYFGPPDDRPHPVRSPRPGDAQRSASSKKRRPMKVDSLAGEDRPRWRWGAW